ncbi:MAG: hypothetical protein HC828_14000 [Blastochloris sp.]|nr:hypothetical protein [Blastochloris sp.]
MINGTSLRFTSSTAAFGGLPTTTVPPSVLANATSVSAIGLASAFSMNARRGPGPFLRNSGFNIVYCQKSRHHHYRTF